MELDAIFESAGIEPNEIEIDTGDVYHQLSRAKLLVSSSSSLCMEAIQLGVPVAIVGNSNGVTMNPLQGRISPEWWRVCYSTDEIQLILNSNMESRPTIPDDIFYTVNKETVNRLIDFS